jgi:hypothetical protein
MVEHSRQFLLDEQQLPAKLCNRKLMIFASTGRRGERAMVYREALDFQTQ